MAERCEGRTLFQGGAFDTTFSNDGIAKYSAQTSNRAVDVAVQSGGKVVAAVNDTSGAQHLTVVRYNLDGSLDSTFGTGGVAQATFAGLVRPGAEFTTTAVAVQPDGRVVVIGYSLDTGSGKGLIARFTANGVLDTSFSGDGMFVIDEFDSGYHESTFLRDVLVQPDGHIVFAGTSDIFYAPILGVGEHRSTFVLGRLLADGNFDSSFADDGRRELDLGQYQTFGSMALGSNGKLVVVGDHYEDPGHTTSREIILARLNSDGRLDSSFDEDGRLSTPFVLADAFSSARKVLVQSDLKIVLACEVGGTSASHDVGLLRLNVNGSRDTTFGENNGRVELENNTSNNAAPRSIALSRTGRYLVGVYTGFSVCSIVSLNPDGSRDNYFAGTGEMLFPTASIGDVAGLTAGPGGTLYFAGGAVGTVARIVDRAFATISMVTFQPSIAEQGSTSASFLVTRQEKLPYATQVLLTLSGSATFPIGGVINRNNDYTGTGIEFTSSSNSHVYVTIPANSTSTFFTITAVNDALVEPTETATFTIDSSTLYDYIPPAAQTISILDNDAVAPTVTAKSFAYQTKPNAVSFVFDQDVAGSVTASDFTLSGLATGVTYAVSYVSSSRTATITFSTPVLADGSYTATLKANSAVAVSGGLSNTAASSLNFFSLAGDANHDRAVDFNDLVVIAQNYGLTGRTYSQGDFSYDGKVDFNDLVTLAQQYGKTLPLAGGLSMTSPLPQKTRRKSAVSF